MATAIITPNQFTTAPAPQVLPAPVKTILDDAELLDAYSEPVAES